MLVQDIMKTDVVTVSPLATLREAMTIMSKNTVKSLVVERRDETDAYGLLTYSAILRTIVAEEGDIDLINVYDVCTKPVITVPPKMDLKYVARLMARLRLARVVVLDSDRMVGIITMNDIVGEVLAMADKLQVKDNDEN
ncbi:MAG: CBS domain-containing protein [Chromatiales bacterium]|nr:CBS domain-containing protein [Chromatiales bacterium]